ncbi:MAG: HlyD family secretion protein [Burkholderiaceae bacterium]|nr:HlyD family secretion protein [Burkholderiaceae bacterium]
MLQASKAPAPQLLVKFVLGAIAAVILPMQGASAGAGNSLAAARPGLHEQVDLRNTEGYTESARLCTLRAPSSGEITAIPVRPGDRVTAGQLLARVGQSDITAPYDGMVSAVLARVGESASSGRHLLTVFDPSRMRVVASIPRSKLRDVNLDDPVEIDFPSSNQRMTAQKVIVISQAERPMQMAKVYLELGATSGLQPGQLARANFAPGKP